MHSFEFRWQPINIGMVVDFNDKYLAIDLVFWTYRYNGLAVRANNRLHWTLRLRAWLKNLVVLGSRQ